MLELCRIRDVLEDDLPMLLSWRNHPDVRRFMFTQHEIGLEEHRKWFIKASHDVSRRLFLIEENNKAIGYVQLSQVVEGGVAEWGFYAKPDAPKGTGTKMGIMVLNHAFEQLKLHKVCGQAIASNQVSIAFHQRMGFTREGIMREQHRIGMSYHDLHCFGLLRTEWKPNNFFE